jgi:hypothetical protein
MKAVILSEAKDLQLHLLCFNQSGRINKSLLWNCSGG